VGEKHLNSLKRSSIAARASTPGGTTRPGSGGSGSTPKRKKISEVDDEKDAASLLVSRCLADAPISQGAVFANAEAQ